jgi:biotin carboxyl carrier protein
MSLYYSPRIITSRISPFPGEILAKKDDNVNPDTIVLRANYRMGRVCIIDVAHRFNISPGDITKYLLKKEDEPVKWSETIARKRSLMITKQIESPIDGKIEKINSVLGVIIIREILEKPDVPIKLSIKGKLDVSAKKLRTCVLKKEGERVEYGETVAGVRLMPYVPFYTNKIVAPCAGEIKKIDYDTGEVWIQKDLPITEMKAHLWGKITKIEPPYGVTIEYSGYVLECAFGTGATAWGKLTDNCTDATKDILFMEYVSSKDINRIIEHPPAGIIAGSIDYRGFELLHKHGVALIIIEGFGKLQMDQNYRNLLLQSKGRNIILKCSTQLRAGVVRPEIIIPSDNEYYKSRGRKGDYRIIWGQHYGKQGTIKNPPYYGESSSGIKTWLCDVVCINGEKISLASSNIIIIE